MALILKKIDQYIVYIKLIYLKEQKLNFKNERHDFFLK